MRSIARARPNASIERPIHVVKRRASAFIVINAYTLAHITVIMRIICNFRSFQNIRVIAVILGTIRKGRLRFLIFGNILGLAACNFLFDFACRKVCNTRRIEGFAKAIVFLFALFSFRKIAGFAHLGTVQPERLLICFRIEFVTSANGCQRSVVNLDITNNDLHFFNVRSINFVVESAFLRASTATQDVRFHRDFALQLIGFLFFNEFLNALVHS